MHLSPLVSEILGRRLSPPAAQGRNFVCGGKLENMKGMWGKEWAQTFARVLPAPSRHARPACPAHLEIPKSVLFKGKQRPCEERSSPCNMVWK